MLETMYKWHKWIGLVIAIPVILWALSGLLHPTLRLTRPEIATQHLAVVPLDIKKIVFNPDAIMRLNGIQQLGNVSVVTMNKRHYYRFCLNKDDIRYFDTVTADELINGEQHYAEYLAHQYLATGDFSITGIERINEFNDEYKAINRFLPVWRIDVKRDDGLRLYVDTETGRLAASVNDLRADMLWWFGVLHNWSYLDQGNVFRIVLFLLVMSAMFIVGLTGIALYGLLYKYLNNARRSNAAYYHRTLGLVMSLSMLMFSFSGGAHVWHKLSLDNDYLKTIKTDFTDSDLNFKLTDALNTLEQQGPIKTISLVKIINQPYYRVVHMQASVPVSYINTQTGGGLENAETIYAKQMASQFSGLDVRNISTVKAVKRFSLDYGFIQRRLPVVNVEFNTEGNPAYYVDLATGKLSAVINDSKRFEKFTFQMFHKWRFADDLGKNGRDAIIAVFIFLNVLVILLGIIMYFSKRSGKQH